MPKRMIDADLFQSADLLDMPATARLLFAGLVVNADDEGIGRADVRWLRNRVLPGLRVSESMVLQHLRSFEAKNMLALRSFNSVKCYVITNFHVYQKLKRPRQSRFDVPEEKGSRREEKMNRSEDEVQNVSAVDVMNQANENGPDPISGNRPLKDFDFGNPYNEDFNKAQAELVDAIAREFCMGYAKAGICVNELGVDMEDWNAWKAYREEHGSRLAVMQIQRFKNPSDIPKEVQGKNQGSKKSFKQQEVEDAKAEAKAMRDKAGEGTDEEQAKKKTSQRDLENKVTNGGIDDVDRNRN